MRFCISCFKKIKSGSYCDPCADRFIANSKPGHFSVKDQVHLKGYGMVSKARLDEMERRVILPYKKGDGIGAGQYYLGRRGENGKIQERNPDYRK